MSIGSFFLVLYTCLLIAKKASKTPAALSVDTLPL